MGYFLYAEEIALFSSMLSLRSSRLLVAGLSLLIFSTVLLIPDHVASENPASLTAEFIGSEACRECHSVPELSESGFNIWEESLKEAHMFALTLPDTKFPEGTNDAGLTPPPDGSSWSDFAYVMGGYGWKATFVQRNGSQLTGSSNAQYNIATGEWTSYHPGEVLSFDVECARCHTTGITPEGSWNGIEEDSLGTWTEIGVRCEGCHGPGSLHATRAFTTPLGETDVLKEVCGDCHNNGGRDGPIPVEDGFVANHAQFQELEASRHGEVSFFTCTTCHEPHVPLRYSELAGKNFNGKQLDPIRKQCQECHPSRTPSHPEPIACVDCHMPPASKSAVGVEYANGGAKGDVASHIWRINPEPDTRAAMFTEDGTFLKADASGKPALSLEFACLGCHQAANETLEWASVHAKTMHETSGTAVEEDDYANRMQQGLISNYPNPFSESTALTFELDEAGAIELSIYNTSGQQIAQIASGEWREGQHQFLWDGYSDAGHSVSSGVYIARLKTNKSISSHKITLMR